MTNYTKSRNTKIILLLIFAVAGIVIYSFYAIKPVGFFAGPQQTIYQYISTVKSAPDLYTIVIGHETPEIDGMNEIQVASELSNFLGTGESATKVDSDPNIPQNNLIILGNSSVNYRTAELICYNPGRGEAVIQVKDDKMVVAGQLPRDTEMAVRVIKEYISKQQELKYRGVLINSSGITEKDSLCLKVVGARIHPSTVQVNQPFTVILNLTVKEVPEGGISMLADSFTGGGSILSSNPSALVIGQAAAWMSPQADSEGRSMATVGSKIFTYRAKASEQGIISFAGRVAWYEAGVEKSVQIPATTSLTATSLPSAPTAGYDGGGGGGGSALTPVKNITANVSAVLVAPVVTKNETPAECLEGGRKCAGGNLTVCLNRTLAVYECPYGCSEEEKKCIEFRPSEKLQPSPTEGADAAIFAAVTGILAAGIVIASLHWKKAKTAKYARKGRVSKSKKGRKME